MKTEAQTDQLPLFLKRLFSGKREKTAVRTELQTESTKKQQLSVQEIHKRQRKQRLKPDGVHVCDGNVQTACFIFRKSITP